MGSSQSITIGKRKATDSEVSTQNTDKDKENFNSNQPKEVVKQFSFNQYISYLKDTFSRPAYIDICSNKEITELSSELIITCSGPLITHSIEEYISNLWVLLCSNPIVDTIILSYSALVKIHSHLTFIPKSIKKLKLLSLQNPQLLVSILSKKNNLEVLDLTHVQLKENIYFLVDAIKNCENLKVLKLGGNLIGEYGAVDIANIIKRTTTIEELDLWGNEITSKGFSKICNALLVNKSISTINLDSNCIDDAYIGLLAQCISFSTTLKSISLNNNSITNLGAAMLSKSLKPSCSLVSLALNTNSIGNQGASKLIKHACLSNIALKIDLRYNRKIKEKGATKILKHLKSPTSIECLIDNGIIHSGMVKLIEKTH